MAEVYLTVAEVHRIQHLLINRFGGLHGIRDKNAIEAAVFRPRTGYYESIEEEAAALMESLATITALSTAISGPRSPLRMSSSDSTACTLMSIRWRGTISSTARWSGKSFVSRVSAIGFAST